MQLYMMECRYILIFVIDYDIISEKSETADKGKGAAS